MNEEINRSQSGQLKQILKPWRLLKRNSEIMEIQFAFHVSIIYRCGAFRLWDMRSCHNSNLDDESERGHWGDEGEPWCRQGIGCALCFEIEPSGWVPPTPLGEAHPMTGQNVTFAWGRPWARRLPLEQFVKRVVVEVFFSPIWSRAPVV